MVVHHYYENEIPNLSRPSVIKQKNVSFSKQKRINLVYCDFFEHLILHALISKEQNNKELVHALISKEQNDKELGFLGYKNGIFPRLYKWYVEGKEPKQKWLMNCFNTAWLNKNDAINILRKSIMLLPKDTVNSFV